MADIKQLRSKFDSSPYALHLGMKIVDLSPGYAKVKMELRNEFLTWGNLIQGGVIASLIDEAFGYSINTLGNLYVAVQLSINFLASPAVGDTIYAEAKVLHAGKSLGVSEITVFDSKGKTIARATGTAISMVPRAA